MIKLIALALATIVFPMAIMSYLLIKIVEKHIMDYWSPEVPVFHKYQIARYVQRTIARCGWFVMAIGFMEFVFLVILFRSAWNL